MCGGLDLPGGDLAIGKLIGGWTHWSAVARNPVALSGLVIDLLPVWGVLVWGWDAVALVMLYWLENLLLGARTLCRIIAANIAEHSFWGLLTGLGTCAFFVIHYGLFSFGHGGILLEVFGVWQELEGLNTLTGTISALISGALSTGANMEWVLAIFGCWYAFAFVYDDILTGEWMKLNSTPVMFEPYGRLVVFHIAVFVVAGALEFLGDAGIGALILVLARAAWRLRAAIHQLKPTPATEPAAA